MRSSTGRRAVGRKPRPESDAAVSIVAGMEALYEEAKAKTLALQEALDRLLEADHSGDEGGDEEVPGDAGEEGP